MKRQPEIEPDSYDTPSGRLHICDACGKQGIWEKPWIWYGSYKQLDDNEPVFKACSEACMARREEVQAQRAIAANMEAAKSEEARLEEELARKRAWRQAVEARLSVPPAPVSRTGEPMPSG